MLFLVYCNTGSIKKQEKSRGEDFAAAFEQELLSLATDIVATYKNSLKGF